MVENYAVSVNGSLECNYDVDLFSNHMTSINSNVECGYNINIPVKNNFDINYIKGDIINIQPGKNINIHGMCDNNNFNITDNYDITI